MANKDHAQRAAEADQIVIGGLARGQDVDELFDSLRAITAQGDMAVGVSLIRVAAEALALGGFSPTDPLEYERLRETYLPEIEFRGRVAHRNSQYALYAAAALRGGVLPDLYADAGWWQGELWHYALYAVVAYVRASARNEVKVPPTSLEHWRSPEGCPSDSSGCFGLFPDDPPVHPSVGTSTARCRM